MYYTSKLYQEDLEKITGDQNLLNILKNKKILITGASGMIGTFLVDTIMKFNELHQTNITVYALSRNLSKLRKKFCQYEKDKHLYLLEQDISQQCQLDIENLDYIIHAASNTHPKEYAIDPIGTITTNILGTYHLLEYVKEYSACRFVLLSSVEIYGENKGDTDYFSEDDCGYINCNTLRAGYPESKRLSEAMIQAYRSQYKIDGVIVRLCRTYGPTVEKDDSKAISQFIKKTVNKEDIILKSEGNQFYSYIYIVDAVTAILTIMTKGINGEAYNVSDKNSDITLKDMAMYLAEISGKNVIYELPDEVEKKGYSVATKALLNSEKIRSLGWKAQYSIREGLKRTVSMMQESVCND